jgi:hypothetical protein
LDSSTKAQSILDWLHEENGVDISDKHVGTAGSHRDESATLRLDGKAHREVPDTLTRGSPAAGGPPSESAHLLGTDDKWDQAARPTQ